MQLFILGGCLIGRIVSLMTALPQKSELNCRTAVHYLTAFSRELGLFRTFGFKRICVYLRVELALAANVVLSGRVVP